MVTMSGTIISGNGVMSRSPTAPIQPIYGDEADCDVAFITSDNWRLPAHTAILENSNVVFRSMFSEEFFKRAEPGIGISSIEITDVDGRSLDNLLRCLYNEPVQVQSIEAALSTLYAAHKYRCPDLVNLCVSYLSLHLKDTNVLSVLKFAKLLAVDYQTLQNAHPEKHESENRSKRRNRAYKATSQSKMSQVSKELVTQPNQKPSPFDQIRMNDDFTASAPLLANDLEDTIESSCLDLLRTCLTLIDRHAKQILESDELEELDTEALTLIFSRDTLNVQDEGKVFNALLRWAGQQCKQQQLPLTIGNKRAVLKESLFLPRYLTMTLKAFQTGPLKSGIFAPEEVSIIQGLISGKLTLTQVTSPHAPLFLTSKAPRCPLPPPNVPNKEPKQSARSKRRRLAFLLRLFRFQNGKCCQKSSNSEGSTPGSSYPTSPVGSHPSSPTHENEGQGGVDPNLIHPNMGRRESQTARVTLFEHIVVCFAYLFD